MCARTDIARARPWKQKEKKEVDRADRADKKRRRNKQKCFRQYRKKHIRI